MEPFSTEILPNSAPPFPPHAEIPDEIGIDSKNLLLCFGTTVGAFVPLGGPVRMNLKS